MTLGLDRGPFDVLRRVLQLQQQREARLKCECCGTVGQQVRWESSRTCYAWSPEDPRRKHDPHDPENPNRDIALCPLCAKEHHEYWDSMWAEYHNGLM